MSNWVSEASTDLLPICDDCGVAYVGPPYYTFEPDSCDETETDIDGRTTEIPHPCTGNMCPSCAGPYLDPDFDDDPRRPEAEDAPRCDEITDGVRCGLPTGHLPLHMPRWLKGDSDPATG